MKRCFLLGIVLLAIAVVPARANFGLFRRQTEVRYYYAPPVYFVPTYRPIYYPVIEMPQPVFVAPPAPALPPPGSVITPPSIIPRATPIPAPPSMTPEPPIALQGTTSLRPGERYHDVYSGASRMTSASDDSCSVAFWNLTAQTMTVNVGGRAHVLAPGRSVTLDLPRSFTWQLSGRATETTQINAGHTTAEVLIRR